MKQYKMSKNYKNDEKPGKRRKKYRIIIKNIQNSKK